MRFFRVVVVLARRLSFAYPSLNLRSSYTVAIGGIRCKKRIFISLKISKKINKIFGVCKNSVIFASVIIQM